VIVTKKLHGIKNVPNQLLNTVNYAPFLLGVYRVCMKSRVIDSD